jgi:hypothetical protein
MVNIVCTLGKIPKASVHRQLDDVPIVSPRGSKLMERFTGLYVEISKKLNVPLAPNCEKHEKAFGPTTFGTVLGVNFDSVTMAWSLPAEKEAGIQKVIDEFLAKKSCTLLEIQKLHGKLSDFALSCSFMLGFRHHLIELLGKFSSRKPDRAKTHLDKAKRRPVGLEEGGGGIYIGAPLGINFWCPPFGKNFFCV